MGVNLSNRKDEKSGEVKDKKIYGSGGSVSSMFELLVETEEGKG